MLPPKRYEPLWERASALPDARRSAQAARTTQRRRRCRTTHRVALSMQGIGPRCSVLAMLRRGVLFGWSWRSPAHRPNHPRRRARHLHIRRPPQVEAKWMAVDVFRLWRVVLHNAVVRFPKHFFDDAHFSPRRAAVRQGNRNVLPSESTRRDDRAPIATRQRNPERAAVIARCGCHRASADSVLLGVADHAGSPLCSVPR